jgi:hypothetical protein
VHQSPNGRARAARYNAGAARKAVNQRNNRRRIMIGKEYHSAARTADEAQRINGYIKEQRRGFIARLADREEAESAPTR